MGYVRGNSHYTSNSGRHIMFDKIKEMYTGIYIALGSGQSEIIAEIMLFLLMGYLLLVGSR